MVGVSLEESTISESSLDASTAPTTATGDSTTTLSHEFPLPSGSTHRTQTRLERASATLAETFVNDVSSVLPRAAEQRPREVCIMIPVPYTCLPPAFLPPPFKQQDKV